ncbi:MAG TPA: hypothetical protein DC013_03375 [Ruminococcaceae bacterium]|nr:hypothetical protein [Oscillospiraceae bacterium]
MGTAVRSCRKSCKRKEWKKDGWEKRFYRGTREKITPTESLRADQQAEPACKSRTHVCECVLLYARIENLHLF